MVGLMQLGLQSQALLSPNPSSLPLSTSLPLSPPQSLSLTLVVTDDAATERVTVKLCYPSSVKCLAEDLKASGPCTLLPSTMGSGAVQVGPRET